MPVSEPRDDRVGPGGGQLRHGKPEVDAGSEPACGVERTVSDPGGNGFPSPRRVAQTCCALAFSPLHAASGRGASSARASRSRVSARFSARFTAAPASLCTVVMRQRTAPADLDCIVALFRSSESARAAPVTPAIDDVVRRRCVRAVLHRRARSRHRESVSNAGETPRGEETSFSSGRKCEVLVRRSARMRQ